MTPEGRDVVRVAGSIRRLADGILFDVSYDGRVGARHGGPARQHAELEAASRIY
jgi:hypothetical protein